MKIKGSFIRFITSTTLIALFISATVIAQSIVSTTTFTPTGVSNNVGFDFEIVVAPDTGLVYLGTTAAYGNDVGVLDPNTDALVTVIPVPTNGALNYGRVNSATGLIYFRQSNSNLVVIDSNPSRATFNQALPTLTLAGQQLQSFALDETRALLYVTSSALPPAPPPVQSQVTIIDVNPASATFHQVLSIVLLPAGALARGIAVNETTNKIYLGATAGPVLSGVYVLDGATLSITKIAGTIGSFGVVVNQSANLVYASAQGNQMIAVDGATDTLLAIIPIPGLITPTAFDEKMAIHTGTGRVYLQSSDVLTAGKLIVTDGNPLSPTFNTVLAAIPVGRAPGAGDVVVDESLNRIITTSLFDQQTSIIDGATNTIIATIGSTQIPSDVALDPATHRVYVANQLNFVQEINVDSAALEATLVTAAESAQGVVNANNNLFYVCRTIATTDVPIFDKSGGNAVVTGLPHGNGRYVFIAANRYTNRIYALNTSANLAGDMLSIPGFVSVIDGSSNAVIANVEAGNQPFGLAINETTNKIYVANANFGIEFPGSITVIDGASNTAVSADTSAFPLSTRFFSAMAVNETSNKLYFQISGGAPTTIGVLDGATNVATPLPASLGPVAAIRVNQTLNRVYVASQTGILHVLDGASDVEIATLPVGSPSPLVTTQRHLTVDESNGRVYVADFNNDTLSVIDGVSNTLITTLAVGDGPTAVAVNDLTNRIYVGNANDKTISVIDGATLSLAATLSLPLRATILSVAAQVSRLYTSSGNAPDHSGVMVISDDAGTFAALRQAIIAATIGDPPGIRNSMLAKADNAEAALNRGNRQAAANLLQALANEVEAQRGKRLTNAEADRILALLAALLNSIA